LNKRALDKDDPSQKLQICDTEYYSTREGFSAFREAVAGAFMPWSMKPTTAREFGGRIASLSTAAGSFARTRMTPLTGERNKHEISRSPEDCLYANYVLSGQLFIEQGDRITTANKGDLIVFDSSLPLRHVKVGDGVFEDLTFSIPKRQMENYQKIFENIAVPKSKIMLPLLNCFTFITENIFSAPPEELAAIGAACGALLPLAAQYSADHPQPNRIGSEPNRYDREMMIFIDHHIAEETLTPGAAAEHLGISVRYVHKRFAKFGTSFSNYVMAKRLELVCRDLVSDIGRHQPIIALAFRWGFSDISTFIRAFKKKFGCTPREYRAKF
jgi:AraC-like DNA-binding protein